jgi:hypothetical protein
VTYEELMAHAAEVARGDYKIQKPKEERTIVPAVSAASSCKSSRDILANDTKPRRAPAYVPPANIRTTAVLRATPMMLMTSRR